MDGGSEGVEAPDSGVSCSICLDLVTENGGRSRAKLHCGHEFHLDCIGSTFNMKGEMQCPNCRRVEKGQWLYANGSTHSFPEFSIDEWIPDEDPYDLSYPEMRQIQELMNEETEQQEPLGAHEAFARVMGPDTHGRVRGFGIGVTPTGHRVESSTAQELIEVRERVTVLEHQVREISEKLEAQDRDYERMLEVRDRDYERMQEENQEQFKQLYEMFSNKQGSC